MGVGESLSITPSPESCRGGGERERKAQGSPAEDLRIVGGSDAFDWALLRRQSFFTSTGIYFMGSASHWIGCFSSTSSSGLTNLGERKAPTATLSS